MTCAATTMPGMGDSETWPKCSGHPHDPRTPDTANSMDDAMTAIEDMRDVLGGAEKAALRGDMIGFQYWVVLLQDYLAAMDI